MAKRLNSSIIPDEVILDKIFLIRQQKVMLDRDLAELYGVTTFRLNEQVKRNPKRFPADFMFKLSQEEKKDLVKKYKELYSLKFSPVLPKVFTEHGAMALANVLNSKKAVDVSNQIIRVFIKHRNMLVNYKNILLKIDQLDKKTIKNTKDIKAMFALIKKAVVFSMKENEKRIGFKISSPKE